MTYDRERFLFAEGRLLLSHNGLWLNAVSIGGDGFWYFIAAGKVQNVSQVMMYDGAWFVVENGILDSDYNVSKTLSNLTTGKTYYVRIRTYKTVNGTTYYSAWSSKLKVKNC